MNYLRLAPSVSKDLSAIWAYTSQAWGNDQADHYIATLHRDMARLLDFPELGPAHPSRVGKFRKLASGHHLIFYLVHGQEIKIVRVLHERMDFDRGLQ